jgi:hypothetical protein
VVRVVIVKLAASFKTLNASIVAIASVASLALETLTLENTLRVKTKAAQAEVLFSFLLEVPIETASFVLVFIKVHLLFQELK